MSQKTIKQLSWATFSLAALLLVAHTFGLEKISVDSTSILLLVVMLVSPFVSTVRKVKWGDLEAEIDPEEVKRLEQAAEIGLAQVPAPPESVPEIHRTVVSILEMLEDDKVLALAKLRIELEKVLRYMIRNVDTGSDKRPNTLGAIVFYLRVHRVIPEEVAGSLGEVLAICNRAMHGESITSDSAGSVLKVGIDLLYSLYWQTRTSLGGRVISEEPISHEEIDRRQSATYRLTTIVPLVDKPARVIREVTQEELDDYFDGYNEVAEFVVGVEEIKS